jgi:protein O-GlcNAc transferase
VRIYLPPTQSWVSETIAPVQMSVAGTADELIEAGIAAESRGDIGGAERFFRQALATDPASARAHLNLGIVLQAKGELAAAEEAYGIAIALDPGFALARYNLALVCVALDRMERAEIEFRSALRLRSEFPEAWVGLAEVLESRGREHEAIAALEAAISQRPQYAGALFNLAVLLRKLGRLDEAEARLRAVPEGDAEFANVMTALAATLRDQGRIEEAVDAMRVSVDRAPDSGVAQSELLFTLGFSERISAEGLFAEHFWAGCRAEFEATAWCPEFPNPPEPERVLNIGYISGDFSGSSVALFTEFLFERHRRDRIRVFAYSSTPVHDETTARFAAAADRWRDVRRQGDAAVANTILQDRIDVLVDLTGHTSHRRIGVLAGRAAPVQMTWLGYLSTTGLTRIDYRISDPIADPVGMTESLHTERLLRMPRSQWCFRPPTGGRDIDVSREPSSHAFTFGSFNQFAKVTDETIALWTEVMLAAPEAKLRVVGVPRGIAAEKLAGKLTAANVGRSRFDLVERLPLEGYYREFARVDACLDTTPYSGGTTTCDALWMGVPVVTLAGERSMSRSAASLLTAAGRADLVAQRPEEYAAIALRLASAGAWSVSDRRELRSRMRTCPLMDEDAFTFDLESLYRKAWHEWCNARSRAGNS